MLHLWTSNTRMAGGHVANAREDDEMSTGTLSDLDVRVREHVVHQLDCDPVVDASGIGVTLTGRVAGSATLATPKRPSVT